jgi:hypothetical protein
MSRITTTRPQRSTSSDRRPSPVRRLWVVAVVGAFALLAGSLVFGGADALAGAAVGLALVALFLLAGRLPFLVHAQLGAGVAFLVLGVNYVFRVVLLAVALVALRDQTWLDPRVVGVVVIVGALGWNAVALRRHLLAGNAPAADAPAADAEAPTVVVQSDAAATGRGGR